MPNYDFQCARDGIFEDISSFDGTAVQSVPCPSCGELSPVVWRRSPSLRKSGIAAIRFGGHTFSEELIEQKLSEKPPDDDAGFWDDKSFDADFVDRFDRNVSLYNAGDLPPVVTDEQIATLKENVAGE